VGEDKGEGVIRKMENPQKVGLARELRRKQTDAERMLWAKLRNMQLEGIKFRRQQPVGIYVVDFISFEEKLIIEIDGGQHNQEKKIEEDEQRTRWLESEGFNVIRFWNNDVLLNVGGVLETIMEVLESNSHPHLASPIKGEGT
jgi:very-short-patch-repair endonuclease